MIGQRILQGQPQDSQAGIAGLVASRHAARVPSYSHMILKPGLKALLAGSHTDLRPVLKAHLAGSHVILKPASQAILAGSHMVLEPFEDTFGRQPGDSQASIAGNLGRQPGQQLSIFSEGQDSPRSIKQAQVCKAQAFRHGIIDHQAMLHTGTVEARRLKESRARHRLTAWKKHIHMQALQVTDMNISNAHLQTTNHRLNAFQSVRL